jgi:hypothetical protein
LGRRSIAKDTTSTAAANKPSIKEHPGDEDAMVAESNLHRRKYHIKIEGEFMADAQ